MKPGKKSTPRPKLDLRKIWAELKEEPPGPIQVIRDPRALRKEGRSSAA